MATKAEIMECLALLTASYPEWQKNLPPQNLRQTFGVYVQMLADQDGDALKEATVRHIRECKFFPKVSELREGALAVRREQRIRGQGHTMLPAPPPSPEERERVKALMADLAEKYDANKPTVH